MERSLVSKEKNALEICNYQPSYIITAKVKQKVLEEDEYLTILDKLVQRDFFPELKKLRLRSDYIDALDSNDVEKLRNIQIQLDKLNPDPVRKETPQNFDGTSDVPHENEPEETTEIDAGMTLDKFLRKNTSEDNASFERIMELTRKKHREKHAWLYVKQQELEKQQVESLALPSSNEEQLRALDNKPNNVDTWKYVPRNALMYTPDGVELSAKEYIQMKGKKEQEIHHKNTRFKADPFDSVASQSSLIKASADLSNMKKAVGKVGVDGKLEEVNVTPKVQGYAFMATPSPAPGVDASPLMTWGEIEGTPLRLDATPSTQGPSFKIPEPPRREQIAHSLAEKASKQHREKRKKALAVAAKAFSSPKNSPRTGSMTSERLSKLSPAAQKLVKTSVRLHTGDKSLRSTYTPSPRSRSSCTPSPKVKTPDSRRTNTPLSNGEEWSITDNLLELPKS